MAEAQGFKRINFFKGFLTTEKDWNDAERYHIDKRRLHNKMMHSAGIVYGFAGDLRVSARSRGDLSVEVQAGYAIDGMGNDLMIHDATIRNISLEEFKLPQTIYIVLRYFEHAGTVKKAISALKKRTGSHEGAIREIWFNTGGIHLSDPLMNLRGILSGVPVELEAPKEPA